MKLSGSNTQHVFFTIGIFKDVVAGSNTQHIFFTMNPSPLLFVVDGFLLGFLFFVLFCSVFLVDKINVRSCVSPPATTRQTPVGGCSNVGYFLFLQFFFFFFNFFKIFIASMSHSYKPSRLGTWHRRHSF